MKQIPIKRKKRKNETNTYYKKEEKEWNKYVLKNIEENLQRSSFHYFKMKTLKHIINYTVYFKLSVMIFKHDTALEKMSHFRTKKQISRF